MIKWIEGDAPGTGGYQHKRILETDQVRNQCRRAVVQADAARQCMPVNVYFFNMGGRDDGRKHCCDALVLNPVMVCLFCKVPKVGMTADAGDISNRQTSKEKTEVLRKMQCSIHF